MRQSRSLDPLMISGQVLDDKYALSTAVGEGGFAVVYRAMHLLLKRPVAIKIFHAAAQFTDHERETLINGFVQEAALLADLSERSTAICQARDVGELVTKEGDHLPYMVLEWLEGRTLEQVLDEEQKSERTPRSLKEAMAWIEPIAEALALAHARGISHRDVKPANVFVLTEARGLKLLDFGVAKVVQDAHAPFSRTGRQSSFTPAYGAPEQFSPDHGSTGPWTDVFALALVLTEIVTGTPALMGSTLVELGAASCDPYHRPTPRALGAKIPEDAEEVFKRALAVATKERYRTAGDFWTALVEATTARPAMPELDTSGSAPIRGRGHRPQRPPTPSTPPQGWDEVGSAPRHSKRPASMAPIHEAPTALERALYIGGILAVLVFGALFVREAWAFVRFQKFHAWQIGTCTIENVRQESSGNVSTVALKSARGVLRADVAESDVETPLSCFGGGDPDPATFTRTRGAEVKCFFDPSDPNVILLRRYGTFAWWPLALLAVGLGASIYGVKWMRKRLDGE